MTSSSSNTSRIAKNTLLLYFRMLLTMGVSLYTSRVVLDVLGVEDYGIYNVVGGVVAMFGILSGSLSSAISRFITFELGKGNIDKLKRIFCTSVNIQVILIAIITILMETIGIWFLNAKMVIPPERLQAANWVFQFSVVTFALNLLSIPYNAVIIAHEKMSAFAYISIIDCTLKLIVAFIIAYNPFDKLVYYGLLIMIVGAINRSIYAIYCKRHFEEATYRMIFDKGLMKEMFGFAGWSFVGCSAQVFIVQGINIIANLFYGVTVNAARGVAVQVENNLRQFVNNFITAINPQITKSFANGDVEYVLKLVYYGAKYSFFLALIFVLPLYFEANFVLRLWLKNVPEYAVIFTKWSLLIILADVLSATILRANAASGKIRNYQLVVGGFNLSIFPISWLCFYLGYPPVVSYIVHFGVFFMNIFVRIRMMRGILPITYKDYISKVFFKIIPVSMVAAIPLMLLSLNMEESWLRLVITGCITIIILPVLIFLLGQSDNERVYARNVIKKFYLEKIKRG